MDCTSTNFANRTVAKLATSNCLYTWLVIINKFFRENSGKLCKQVVGGILIFGCGFNGNRQLFDTK